MRTSITPPIQLAYMEEYYTSFPDLIRVGGSFVCVYRESDEHHPTASRLMVASSSDGEKWETNPIAVAEFETCGYVYNCPKLSVVDNKLVVICDTKTSQQEGSAAWNMQMMYLSSNFKRWGDPVNLNIQGMVPDRIVHLKNKMVMGYHIIEDAPKRKRLVQMMAESYDKGQTWRDRKTVCADYKHDFCEGSIISTDGRELTCFMRDNRGISLRAYMVQSPNEGRDWGKIQQLNLKGHRIAAGIKKKPPYDGSIIGTFRNTADKTISLFITNPKRNKTQVFPIDKETNDRMWDFGYSGWAEADDGGILVVYYIRRNKPNPEICVTKVNLV